MKHRPSSCLRAGASVLGAAASLLLLACESGTQERDVALEGLPPAGQLKLQLTRSSDDCDDLLGRIQDSLVVPLAERAKQLRDPQSAGIYGPGAVGTGGIAVDDVAPPGMTAAPNAGNPGSAPSGGEVAVAPRPAPVPQESPAVQTPSDPGNDAAEGAPSNNPGPSSNGGGFSGTTVQIKDVDEADIVKADGDRIYLLHGGTLFVLQGWPATSTSILGSALVEGQPTEMFVRDGKAVVFSSVYLNQGNLPGGKPVPYDYGYYYGYGSTKITVLDVTTPTPRVLRESYLEGDYVSARRHDGLVRAVVQNGFKVPQIGNPYIEYVDVFGHPYPQEDIDAQVDDWLDRTVRAIRNTEIGDWLPREYSRVNGTLVEEPTRCGDYYSPEPGLTEQGVTSVVALDLSDVSAPLSGATILGRAERVYANEDVVLVTQTDYRYQLVRGSSEQTIIHQFDIDGGATAYVASGGVAGRIHDQFSLDERDGVIRVSTTEQNWQNWGIGVAPTPPTVGMTTPATPQATPPVMPDTAPPTLTPPGMTPPEPESAAMTEPKTTRAPDASVTPAMRPAGPVNRVVTLSAEGDELVQLGATQDFGINETIYSTRFIGDLGYVVTFRQIDPLVVVDLSDPRRPTVVGELKVPGYSSFLFPFGEDHLFAIGQDATPEGFVQGLSLSIFDVSNPASPALAHRYPFPSGASPANVDHRAISFHTRGDIVAFPYRNNEDGRSSLEVFQLSIERGFERLGGMLETPTYEECLTQYFGYGSVADAQWLEQAYGPEWRTQVLRDCAWSLEFRRGLFRDDFVYGISNNGVYAYDLGAMDSGAVGRLSLPRAQYGSAPPGAMGGGSAGMASATPSVDVTQPVPSAPPNMNMMPSGTPPSAPAPGMSEPDPKTDDGTDPDAP